MPAPGQRRYRMRTALLLPFFALATLGQAQFTSDLESWNDTLPTDWFGVKTNISSDSVEKVTVNPHAGAFAVRLYNGVNTTKRFTTQPVSVDSAQAYDVSLWVRGQGEFRVALYDARTANSGYSPTGPYTTVSSDSWTEYTSTIVASRTGSAAEFIIYVRNTSAPERLVVDDVNITTGVIEPPVEASIYAIQYTTSPDGVSSFDGDAVITGGIVTGVDTIGADAYFIQAGSGPWSGIYVYDQSHTVAIGDSVQITAVVDEFSGATTELTNVSAFAVIGQYPLPTPQLLDTQGATEEQWEGVLAVIANAECTTLPDGFGEWGITQPSGAYLVDDLMFAYTPIVGESYDITGCIHYANGAWKIEPRFAADIVAATSIDENSAFGNASFGPNPVSDVLRINTGLPIGTRTGFALTDALGRTVRTGALNGNGTLTVNDLTPGFYHLTLRATNGVKSFAVEVQ